MLIIEFGFVTSTEQENAPPAGISTLMKWPMHKLRSDSLKSFKWKGYVLSLIGTLAMFFSSLKYLSLSLFYNLLKNSALVESLVKKKFIHA